MKKIIQERRRDRAKPSTHWPTELVDELADCTCHRNAARLKKTKENRSAKLSPMKYPEIFEDRRFDEESTANINEIMASSDTSALQYIC